MGNNLSAITEPARATETYLTLREACDRFFGGAISPDSLRAEAQRGNLTIFKIGNKHFVTPDAIMEMKLTCGVTQNPQGSTSTPSAEHGSFETDRVQSAQVAAKQIAMELSGRSPNTSRKRSNQQSANIIPIASRSPKS